MPKWFSSSFCGRALAVAALGSLSWAQSAPPASATTPTVAESCEITGKVTAGNVPLPGVAISAANSLTGKRAVTSSELDGSYALTVGPKGRFVVRAEFAAFQTATSEVVVNAGNCHPVVNLPMTLLSRVQRTPTQQGIADGEENEEAQAGSGQGTSVAAQRGFQNLGLSMDSAAGAGSAASTGGETSAAGMPPSSFVSEGATESVAIAGSNNAAQSNEGMFGPGDMRGGDGGFG